MWKWLKALNPFESDNYHPWMREEIAALRAELDAAEIELADKAFYVREFAAVSAERDALKAAQPQSTPLSDEMIERMAMAAREGFYGSTVSHRDWDECSVKDLWCDAIRAALAAVGPQYNPADVAFNSRVPELEKKIDNQRMNLRQRPEGLPTAEELKQVYRDGWNEGAGGDTCASGITAILAALAPWLREPVGWELDVTAEELSDILLPVHRQSVTVMQATRTILDLCRSRIRPTFECKECAVIRAERDEINKNYMGLVDLLLPYLRAAQAEAAARAALDWVKENGSAQ